VVGAAAIEVVAVVATGDVASRVTPERVSSENPLLRGALSYANRGGNFFIFRFFF
jgi:hypothetical protein